MSIYLEARAIRLGVLRRGPAILGRDAGFCPHPPNIIGVACRPLESDGTLPLVEIRQVRNGILVVLVARGPAVKPAETESSSRSSGSGSG
eukprot:COSAG01_NODE_3247_length_6356_cov_29.609397_3_plen_90_part_00